MMRHPLQMSLEELVSPYRSLIRRSFLLLMVVLGGFLFWVTDTSNPLLILIALSIFALALVPAALWATGRVGGFPIAPAILLGEIFLFSVPILSDSPRLSLYTESEIARAGMTEIVFLICFLLSWFYFVRRRPPLPGRILALPLDRIGHGSLDRLWLVMLALASAYSVAQFSGWLDPLYALFPAALLFILRTVLSTIGIAAAFFLGASMGMRSLGPLATLVYLAFLIPYILSLGVSLLLSSVVGLIFAALIGFAIGRGRIPWIALILVIVCLQVLHVGKEPLRLHYWGDGLGTRQHVTLAEYPSFYTEWFSEGLRLQRTRTGDAEAEDVDLLDRASLIQMLLYAQVRAPEHIEYLRGETLAVIPQLLIPRLLWPEKPRAHEGQVILNVHFGRQTIDETERTYISWGMLAEFYANFGWAGAVLLGILFGAVIGWISAFPAGVPLGTYRALVAAVLFVGSATASQMAMSIWVTSNFQALVAATLFALVFMRPIELERLVGPDGDSPGREDAR